MSMTPSRHRRLLNHGDEKRPSRPPPLVPPAPPSAPPPHPPNVPPLSPPFLPPGALSDGAALNAIVTTDFKRSLPDANSFALEHSEHSEHACWYKRRMPEQVSWQLPSAWPLVLGWFLCLTSLLLLWGATLQSFRECHGSFGPLRTRPEHQAIVSLPATCLKQFLLWSYLPIPLLVVGAASSSYSPASRLVDLFAMVILSCGLAPFSAFGLWGRASGSPVIAVLKGLAIVAPPLALLLPVVGSLAHPDETASGSPMLTLFRWIETNYSLASILALCIDGFVLLVFMLYEEAPRGPPRHVGRHVRVRVAHALSGAYQGDGGGARAHGLMASGKWRGRDEQYGGRTF